MRACVCGMWKKRSRSSSSLRNGRVPAAIDSLPNLQVSLFSLDLAPWPLARPLHSILKTPRYSPPLPSLALGPTQALGSLPGDLAQDPRQPIERLDERSVRVTETFDFDVALLEDCSELLVVVSEPVVDVIQVFEALK